MNGITVDLLVRKLTEETLLAILPEGHYRGMSSISSGEYKVAHEGLVRLVGPSQVLELLFMPEQELPKFLAIMSCCPLDMAVLCEELKLSLADRELWVCSNLMQYDGSYFFWYMAELVWKLRLNGQAPVLDESDTRACIQYLKEIARC